MNDAVAATRTLGNIATRRQLLERGVSPTTITAALRLGSLRRVRRAHFATPDADFAAVVAVRVGGRLCGPSAARSYRLWSGDDRRIHVAVARNAGRLRTQAPPSTSDELTVDFGMAPIELHWIDWEPHLECWRVRIDDCVRQMVAWTDAETAIACLDTALTVGGIPRRALREWFFEQPPRSRLRAAQARWGSESGPESIVRQRLAPHGLQPRQQVRIDGVGRVDMLLENLVIEIDSRTFHAGAVAFEEDRRRDAELLSRGYVVVRLSYRRIMGDWPWCVARVLDALEQARALRVGHSIVDPSRSQDTA